MNENDLGYIILYYIILLFIVGLPVVGLVWPWVKSKFDKNKRGFENG